MAIKASPIKVGAFLCGFKFSSRALDKIEIYISIINKIIFILFIIYTDGEHTPKKLKRRDLWKSLKNKSQS